MTGMNGVSTNKSGNGEQSTVHGTSAWKKAVAISVGGFLFVVTVVAAVVLSVKLSCHDKSDKQTVNQEYHTTYYTKDEVIKETISVSNREEMVEAENVTVVFDFQTGFVVYKFHSREVRIEDCYIANFNTSEQDEPQSFSKDTDPEIQIHEQSRSAKMELTDIPVNKLVLGPQSRAVCTGKQLFFMTPSKSANGSVDRRKRADGSVKVKFCVWRLCVSVEVEWSDE